MAHFGDSIFFIYQTDAWHTYDSRVLLYIGISQEDCAAQIEGKFGCTTEQAYQLATTGQSDANENGYAFDIEEQIVGTLVENPYY